MQEGYPNPIRFSSNDYFFFFLAVFFAFFAFFAFLAMLPSVAPRVESMQVDDRNACIQNKVALGLFILGAWEESYFISFNASVSHEPTRQ
jgi:hypothetical protein